MRDLRIWIFAASAVALILVGYALVVPNLHALLTATDRIRSGSMWAAAAPFLPLIYLLVCAATIALCFPVAALITVIGGAIFGLEGFPLALFGITLGSIAPFLIARKFAAPALARVDARLVEKFRNGFSRNGFHFLVLMRLAPWAPFSVTTIVAGALETDFVKFIAATSLGFIPAGLALNAIGHGLTRVADFRSLSATELLVNRDFILAALSVGGLILFGLLRRRVRV